MPRVELETAADLVDLGELRLAPATRRRRSNTAQLYIIDSSRKSRYRSLLKS